MSGYYDEEYVSEWEQAYSEAFQRVMEKFGVSGLDIDEIPADLLKQIEQEVLEEVGPNPDEEE